MVATNLLGRMAESKRTGTVFEIVAVKWPTDGMFQVMGEDGEGNLLICFREDILMLDDEGNEQNR